MTDGLSGNEKSRVGNARGAGVGDQRDVLSRLDPFDEGLCRAVFVEHVVGLHGRIDAEVVHQFARSPGILGQNKIGLPQGFYRAGGHIAHVAHRSGDQIQFGHLVSTNLTLSGAHIVFVFSLLSPEKTGGVYKT